MSTTTKSLRLVQTSTLANGTYKVQINGTNTIVTAPLNNFFHGVSSISVLSFTLSNSMIPNVETISSGKKSPGIHILSNTSDVVMFSGYYPYLYDQGICVLAKWINSANDEGWLILKTIEGNIKVDFTTSSQSIPIITTDHGAVSFIAPRFLRVQLKTALNSTIGVDINTCYFGDFNGKNAVWLPIIADTTITYANMGNSIVGYQAVPEVISPTPHNSLLLEEGDMLYYCSIDARDYQPSGFPDSVAFDIAKNLPDVNGDKVRWIAIVWQTLDGLENSPMLVKLYNVGDTTVELVNSYRDGNVDYSSYENGVAGTLAIDETYFVEATETELDTTSPSVYSHAMNLRLEVSYQSVPLESLHVSEVKIMHTDTSIILYMPAVMASLDFSKVGDKGDCHLFRISDIGLWDTIQKLTHAHVYYSNDDQSRDEIGLFSANSLVIRPLSVERVEVFAHVYDPVTHELVRIDIPTTILAGTIPSIVEVSGNTPSFAFQSLCALNAPNHYFNPDNLSALPADAEENMLQPGENPTVVDRIDTFFPRQIAGFDYLRTVSLQRNFSDTDKSHVFTIDVDMGESDTLAVYANVSVDVPFGMPVGGMVNITVVDSSLLDYSYTLSNPSGIIRISIDFVNSQLYYTVGDTTNGHNITLTNGWTPLLHIQVSEDPNGTKVALYDGSTLVTEEVTQSPWSNKYTVHMSTGSIAKAGTLRLANFAAYSKGSAITGNKMLPFVKRDGDIDASVVTWEVVDEEATNWDSDLRAKASLYVPKFFLDDNPFAEGVYKVELEDDLLTNELSMVVFPTVSVVDLRSVPNMVDPAINITREGEIYLAISKVISDHSAPLKISSGVRLCNEVVKHHVDSKSVMPYTGNWVGSYNESNFMESYVEGPHQYKIQAYLTPVLVNSTSSIPSTLASTNMYIVNGGGDNYTLLFNAGILNFDSDCSTACALSVTLPGIDMSVIQEIAICPFNPFKTIAEANDKNSHIIPPSTANSLLIYPEALVPADNTYQTLNFKFCESEDDAGQFIWKSTDISGTGDVSIALSRFNASRLSTSLLKANPMSAFDGPVLLNLVHKETQGSDFHTNEVVVTRDDDGSLILLLAAAWVNKDVSDFGVVKFPLESANSKVIKQIQSSLFISRYIILDASISDGSGINLDVSEPDSEVLALSLNDFASNPDNTIGFTLSYRYRDNGINTTYTWDGSTTSFPNTSVSLSPTDMAIPRATHFFTSEYPHGLIIYGTDTNNLSTNEALIDESVDGSTHEIVLTMPCKAFYNNGKANSFIRYIFKIETPYRTEYAAAALGVCVSRDAADIQSLPYYTRGNLSIHTARTGVVNVYYHNGTEWNDVLLYTQEIIIKDTAESPVLLPLTTCESIHTPDDVFHRPVVLRSIYKLDGGYMAGNEVYTQLTSLGVTIYLPNIWLSLDRTDTSVASFTASNQASIAVHHVRTVVMYSGNNRGSISDLEMSGSGTETVVFSRNNTGVSLYVIKDGIVIQQEDLIPTSTTTTVGTNPIIPSTPAYITGFIPLQRRIGNGQVVVRTLSQLGEALPSEASYVITGTEHRVYFMSMVLSGNLDDTSMVYVEIDNLSLRAKLLTGPMVCFFNGKIGVTGLDRESGIIYIGRDDFSHAMIVFNTDGNPYLANTSIPVLYTTTKIPSPRTYSFAECDTDIGCDTALLGGAEIHTEYVDPLVPMVGQNSGSSYFVTSTSLLMQVGDTSLTPINISYDVPPINLDDVYGFSFHCRREPRGETSIQPVGLPTSLEGFMITLTETNASHIQHYGSNLLPSIVEPGITVTFGRYSNTQVVIRETSTNRILLTRDVNPLPGLSTSNDNPKNIEGGYHDIEIAIIRGGVGTFVYVYVNGRLLSYTVDVITWFEPKAVSFHFHNNYHTVASENILYPRIRSRLVELGCLPFVVDLSVDCPNKEPNLTASTSMVLVKDTLHMVTSLQSVCDYGYLHITLSNPTTQISNIEISVSDSRYPMVSEQIVQSPVTLSPGGVLEIPLVTVVGDQKLFVKSNTSGVVLRSCSMENVVV